MHLSVLVLIFSELLNSTSAHTLKGRHVNENIFIGWLNGLFNWKLIKPIGRVENLEFDKNKDREEGDYVTYYTDDFDGWDKLPNMMAGLRRLPDVCVNNSSCVLLGRLL